MEDPEDSVAYKPNPENHTIYPAGAPNFFRPTKEKYGAKETSFLKKVFERRAAGETKICNRSFPPSGTSLVLF